MAFPRPQQKWVRKPSPLLSGESPGPRGPAKGQEDRTLHLFGVILSPNPPFRPFLLIFLLFPPGLTGDTCASECCFWRSHYCWSYLQLGTWAEKWVDAIVRLCLELGSPHWEATSCRDTALYDTPRSQGSGCKAVPDPNSHHRQGRLWAVSSRWALPWAGLVPSVTPRDNKVDSLPVMDL